MCNRKVLIIIPAYNEANSIRSVINDIKKQCPEYQYVIVCDGSTDDTEMICKENGYNYISLPVNLGLASAFQTGMKYALCNEYDFAIQFDGDGQHEAKCIKEMVECIGSNQGQYDIVIGSRFLKEGKPVSLRMIGSRLISACIKVTTGIKLTDPTSGMRIYNKKTIRCFAHESILEPEPDSIALLIKHGYHVTEIPVQMNERNAGESYLNGWKSIQYMLRICSSILFVQWFRRRIG